MILYANLGQRDKMMSAYRILVKTNPTADDKANADYTVASYDYKQWSPTAGDTGQNRQTRFGAEAALTSYYQTPAATAGRGEVRGRGGVGDRQDEEVRRRHRLPRLVQEHGRRVGQLPREGTGQGQQERGAAVAVRRLRAPRPSSRCLDEAITASFDDPAKHKYARERERHLRRGRGRPEDEEAGHRTRRQGQAQEEGQVPGERRRGREVGPRSSTR